MKISALLMMLFALCLIPVSVKGADIDGKWLWPGDKSVWRPDMYFTFKADGKTLYGMWSSAPGREIKISKGKISGDRISFIVVIIDDWGDITETFKGVIKGDEITLTLQVERDGPKALGPSLSGIYGPDPGGSYSSNRPPPPEKILLKKVKE